MIRIGVIGYGYWGPNLVRNVSETPGAAAAWVSDLSRERLDSARARHPALRVSTDYRELIGAPDVDAVVVATPVDTHFEIALCALRAGKHVLVEKPITTTSGQAARLIDEAAARGLCLMVDHTFVYHGAVRRMREIVDSGDLGEVYYFDSTRVNLGIFQRDVNVLWDLAVHDLSILDALVDERPVAVSATGMSHVAGGAANIAYLTLFFGGTKIAHIHVNWLAPVKVRRTLIGGSRKMIVYDDLEPSEKVKVYDKGITVEDRPDDIHRLRIGYRSGDMWAPSFDTAEALRTEMAHFVACVDQGLTPETDGEAGLRVVETLEAATRSLGSRGRTVELRPGVPAG